MGPLEQQQTFSIFETQPTDEAGFPISITAGIVLS
jgi:hypothetical protein